MGDDKSLIDLVNAYRSESDLDKRLKIATQIFGMIETDLRLFIFGRIHGNEAEDIMSESVKAIFTSLHKFRGYDVRQFRYWFYRIASFKIADYLRRIYGDAERFDPLPIEEMQNLLKIATQSTAPLSDAKMDVDYIMALLAKAKPECYDVLWKHFLSQIGVNQLSVIMALRPDTLRRRIQRCIKALRKLLGLE